MDLVNRVMHRVIFPKGLRGLQQGAQTSAAAAAKKGAAESFKVLRTKYLPDGLLLIGNPVVGGVQMPIRTVVKLGLGPTKKGRWAIWPESVDIFGLRSKQVLKAVRAAMATAGPANRHVGRRPDGEASHT
jgi:hypothetical protein